MSKKPAPPPKKKPATVKGKTRRVRGPGRSPDDRMAVLEARLARVRQRAETQLLRAAGQAGLFKFRFTIPALRQFLQTAMAQAPLPVSVLHKRQHEIDQIKSRRTKNARANDARRKAVLGAFMVAQFRHKPALHAELAPDLRAHLASHPRPEMAEANIAFMARVTGDPASAERPDEDDTGPTGLASEQARRNQARRMILAGAWVLDRRTELPAIETLLGTELANFLRQDRTPARNIALLQEVLGAF